MDPILLVTHSYSEPCNELSQIDGLIGVDGTVERFEIDDHDWRLPSLSGYSAVVLFVRFRDLLQRSNVGWGGFSGPKVMLDQDSFMDFRGWHGRSPYEGKWAWAIPHFGFDALFCTGALSKEHFRERGIRVLTLHKAYDPAFFYPEGRTRSGICHYGSPYSARKVMLRKLRRAGVGIDAITAPYTSLGHTLNDYSAVVVCNMTSTIRGGRIGASVEYRWPGSLLRVEPAPEPMIKNFEAMGAGCCVFMDRTIDDEALGFVDGQTCVLYSDFDELTEKVLELERNPIAMAAIGFRGQQLVSTRHKWSDRGTEFRHLVRGLLAG